MPDLFFTEQSDLETIKDLATRELPLLSRKTKSLKPIIEDTFLGVNTKAKELMDQVNFVATHRQSEYLAELLIDRKSVV